jgi:hypothetical protein
MQPYLIRNYYLCLSMKKVAIIAFSITAILLLCLAFTHKKEKPNADSNTHQTQLGQGFALIELYTSEGCSSCPPAEKFMDKLMQKAEGLPVYVLEFHVDYWDYLGWKDSLAKPEYSKRQQDYLGHFYLSSMYTPQAIVNGESEMLGSDESKVNAVMQKELLLPASVSITCTAHKTGDSKIEVDYSLPKPMPGNLLNCVLVESDLTTHINKGENEGKTLTHDNAVRVFESIKAESASGKISLDASHVNLAHARVICYLQNTSNFKIIAAGQVASIQ